MTTPVWIQYQIQWSSTQYTKKSQNCVKAAIALVCTTCKRQLLFALLQLMTFVCTTAIENILNTTSIVNFCMHYCNCQCFYGTTTFVWTIIATITINKTLLQLLTFRCTMVIDNFKYTILQLAIFVCTIAFANFWLDYCNWGLLHAADQHWQHQLHLLLHT